MSDYKNKYKLGVEIKKHLMLTSKTWRIKNYVAIKRRASCESTKGGEDSGNPKRPPRQEDRKGEGRRDRHGMNGKEHFGLKDCKSSSEVLIRPCCSRQQLLSRKSTWQRVC